MVGYSLIGEGSLGFNSLFAQSRKQCQTEDMLSVLTHHDYRRLFTAQVVALLGTGLATIALALIAYDLAQDQAGRVLGTALTIKMVAYVLIAPLANAVVAELPRKAVLVGANLVRGSVAFTLSLVTEVWQIYLLIFVLQAASATYTPAFQSLIPLVLTDEQDYTSALSLSRLASDLEQVVSPTLAAALLVVVSNSVLFYGTALGFLASAALVATLALTPGTSPEHEVPLAQRLRQGVALFVSRGELRPILAVNFVVAISMAFVIVQTIVVARTVFGLGESAVAWLLGANGLGSMTAALILPRLLRVSERQVMRAAVIALPILNALVPLALWIRGAAGLALLVGLWVGLGFAWSCAEIPVARVIRRAVTDQELSAAFAAQFSLSHACWLVGYALVGWLGQADLGTTPLVLAGLGCLGAVVAYSLWATTPATMPLANEPQLMRA